MSDIHLHAGAEEVNRLLADAPVGFAFFDRELRHVRINEVLARGNRYSAAEHIGRNLREVNPQFADQAEQALAHVLATGEVVVNDNLVKRVDGQDQYLSVQYSPARERDGSIAGVAVIAVDVTERRLAQRWLERSEARYRTLVQATAMDVWRTDAEGHLIGDMPAWRSVTGQSADEVLGFGWVAGVHPEDRERAWSSWRECMRERCAYVCEYRIGSAATGWRTVVARCLPIIEGDVLVEWVGTTLDITDVRGAEVAREEAFSRLRAEALTLQRSILPEQAFQPEELEVCARYVPGAPGTEVGGDWYDVIPLAAGRVGLVVGDVMGRGVRAAAVMGQLRTAVRAFSRLDLRPAELLGLLDGLVAELKDEQIVTCTYAVYDPGTQLMTLANAGHLPTVVVRRDGESTLVTENVGPPLGLGLGVFTEVEIRLEPGALLALYTDGLVEGRRSDIDQGITALVEVLSDQAEDMEAHCTKVLERLGRSHGHEDDVALLLVRLPLGLEERTRVERLDLPRGIRSVRQARAFCQQLFSGWELEPQVAEAARLVVNELVTNALVHGRPPVSLMLRRTSSMLYVEVFDASGHRPHRRVATAEDEGGRGLHLVAELSERWGVRPAGDGGKAVWVAIALHQQD